MDLVSTPTAAPRRRDGKWPTTVPLDGEERRLVEALAQRDRISMSAVLRLGLRLYARQTSLHAADDNPRDLEDAA